MDKLLCFFLDHFVLCIVWLVLGFSILFIFFRTIFSKIREVVHFEVIHLINHSGAIIVDVRDRKEYCEAHIINSIHLLPQEVRLKKFGKLINMKNQPIIVVCSYGFASRSFAKDFVLAGFIKVYILKNGMFSWKEEKLPVVNCDS
ncbi:MAG: putative sulfurtransferase YibN [Candidatus Westeberhardia cardiocondylae]|nr:putative sulfurtransferase YibN [Candidatus Westeberhardia cardiocondylae]